MHYVNDGVYDDVNNKNDKIYRKSAIRSEH